MSQEEINRLELYGELMFFFYCTDGSKNPRCLLMQQAFTAIDSEGEHWDEKVIYSVCYGYSGGGVQSDFLFKQDFVNWGTIYYGDCSGDEWRGARDYSKESPYEIDVEKDLTWTEYDSHAYEVLMSNWDAYFEISEAGDDILLKEEHLRLLQEGSMSSDGFDNDCLQDFSGIWNFLTSYR